MNAGGVHGFRIALQRLRGGGVLALLWVFLGSATAGAAGDAEPVVLYQWTDSHGSYRYTPDYDRVPADARDSVVTIQTGEGPPQDTPIYFDPDPRSKQVQVPVPEPASGTARGVPRADTSEYDDRIHELGVRIAEYEEALKALISDPGTTADEVPPELREIANRLPQLQAELDSLQRGRARSGQP